MSKREFGIYIPSYKRAATISTHKLLEYYKVVVRKSEETEYLKVIPKENLIAVPDEEINNIVKVVNWIVDNSEEEVIAMIDDDMNDLIYRLDFNEKITDPEVITSELERIAQLRTSVLSSSERISHRLPPRVVCGMQVRRYSLKCRMHSRERHRSCIGSSTQERS